MSVVVRMERLAPPGPKRTEAHRRNGRRKAIWVWGDPGRDPAIGSMKVATPTPTSVVARRAASALRAGAVLRIQAGPTLISITIAGGSASSARVLEKNRVRQTSQYGSSRIVVTTPASANEDAKGARGTAPTMKTTTRGSRSKLAGAALKPRTKTAATTGSPQVLAKRPRTRGARPTP